MIRFELAADGGERVAIEDGRIVERAGGGALRIDLGVGELRPGLINAHDHLFLNHFPRLGEPPYASVYAWAEDVQSRFAQIVRRYRQLPLTDALLFGALKNLAGGVTTVVHHDVWSAEVERLPVRALRVRVVHSLGLERDLTAAVRGDDDTRNLPLCLHLAEGVDARCAAEIHEAGAMGLLGADTLAVHVLGADDQGCAVLRAAGAAVVWCPTSNLHLYGRTIPRALTRSGVDILLGTDSLLSGDGTLLHELRAARRAGHLADAALIAAVGDTAARRMRIPRPTLEAGARADVAFFRRGLLEAGPSDVALVLVGGRPRFGEPAFADLFERTVTPFEELVVGDIVRLVEAPLASVARRVLRESPACGRIFD